MTRPEDMGKMGNGYGQYRLNEQTGEREWRHLDGWYSDSQLRQDDWNFGVSLALAPFTCGASLMGYGLMSLSDYEEPSGGYGGGYGGQGGQGGQGGGFNRGGNGGQSGGFNKGGGYGNRQGGYGGGKGRY
ncbi:hypothetical protein [Floridanema aerugineum]|uniref:Glycine-rich protein n=1 Tax=Floridaenema aerugineum BLCC-F46 TaxID=3153654 RepID=A0ABV4X2A5_9CYAN